MIRKVWCRIDVHKYPEGAVKSAAVACVNSLDLGPPLAKHCIEGLHWNVLRSCHCHSQMLSRPLPMCRELIRTALLTNLLLAWQLQLMQHSEENLDC